MMPLAASSMAMTQTTYTNGVAAPENGVENCGLKKVDTAGPMMAADMMTAPPSPMALAGRGGGAGSSMVEVTDSLPISAWAICPSSRHSPQAPGQTLDV